MTNEPKRSRGRPATGQDPAISSRVSADVARRIAILAEAGRGRRSDVIRLCLERGLDVLEAERAAAD